MERGGPRWQFAFDKPLIIGVYNAMKMTRERNAWIGLVALMASCVVLFRQEQAVYDREEVREHAAAAAAYSYADQDLALWQPEESAASVSNAAGKTYAERIPLSAGSGAAEHSYP